MSIPASSSKLNRYGFRVLTQGIDFSNYQKNPVMLADHEMSISNILGRFVNLRVEGDTLMVEPEWDEDDDKALKYKKKYEKGYLKALSIGFRPLAFSDDPKDMLAGQTRPTITKAELMEISWVTVPGNSDSVRLYMLDEQTNQLAARSVDEILPPISSTKSIAMKKEFLAIIGLAADASEADIENKLNELAKPAPAPASKPDGVLEALTALSAKVDNLESKFSTETVKLSAIVDGLKSAKPISTTDDARKDWGFLEWSKNDPKGLAEIQQGNPEEFKRLVDKSYKN